MAEMVNESIAQVDLDGRSISYSLPHEMEVVVDVLMFRRLILNLLTNVVRYTPVDTHVTITAEHETKGFCFGICDTGPGVGPELLPSLCDAFVRGEPSRNRTTGGLGLGLLWVRLVAEAHGGSVVLSTPQGGGFEAQVRIPQPLVVPGPTTPNPPDHEGT